MKVNREGWLVKWAYLLKIQSDESVPYTTSVCALFWRCVLVTPIHIVVFLATITGVGFVLIAPWFVFQFHNVLAIWTGLAFVGILIAGIATQTDDDYIHRGELDFVNLVGEYIGTAYSKVCPIVKIERG